MKQVIRVRGFVDGEGTLIQGRIGFLHSSASARAA
jgi:hypothetical protein